MIRPPRVAERLVAFCAPGRLGDALLGDLAEEWADRSSGRTTLGPRLWYWSQAVRSLWPALTTNVRRGDAGRLIAAVLLGVAILWVIGDAAMSVALGGLRAAWPGGQTPASLLEVAYLAGLTPSAVLAGYATARLGLANGPLAAVALAAIVALPGIVAAFTGAWSPPTWSHALWFALGPLGVLLGARRASGRVWIR